MAFDRSQFFQVFFEESGEHLAEIEKLLLEVDVNSPNQDDLDAIFRAVHSMKGGAATFGFKEMTEVAHIFESVLAQLRSGKMQLDDERVELFLQTKDVLLQQMIGQREGTDVAPEAAAQVLADLREIEREHQNRPGAEGTHKVAGSPATEEGDEEDPGYGFFDDIPSSQGSGQGSGQDQTESDPGYGFFEEISPPKEAPSAGPEDRRESSQGRGGSRATDLASAEELPLKGGRRATDRMITAAVQPEAATVRVDVKKIDLLMNQVGELVITQAMLDQTTGRLDPVLYERLHLGLAQLDRNTRNLQQSIMAIRMVPVQMVFARFPRVVRDLARKVNKQVELQMFGVETEIDKGFVEKLIDPLTHLLRNSLDHGLESSKQRIASGKPAKGKITLAALHRGGNLVIEVSDDGAGLNRQKILAKAREQGLNTSPSASNQEVWQTVFAPGFSTAEKVSDVSGRGVGLDVVRKNIQSIGGHVEIQSEAGSGTKFTLQLPLTTAIIDGMTVRVGSEVYILPLNAIVESVRPKRSELKSVVEKGELVQVRGECLLVLRLYKVFGVKTQFTDPTAAVLIILESEGQRLAILVDEILGQRQVVIKSLEENFKKVEGIAAATILGDGQVAFILDVRGLLNLLRRSEAQFCA